MRRIWISTKISGLPFMYIVAKKCKVSCEIIFSIAQLEFSLDF